MRGRKPKPAAVHEASGNPSELSKKELEARSSVVVPDGDVECPAFLDAYAREAWRYYYPILRDMRVMTIADADILTQLCQYLSDARQLREGIYFRKCGKIRRKMPLFTEKNRDGVSRPSANFNNAYRAEEAARKCMSELGLTPVARSRLGVSWAKSPGDNSKESLMGWGDPRNYAADGGVTG